MFTNIVKIDAGPATLVPLVHIPQLKEAPRKEWGYKAVEDSLGDLCHFYGDFSGFHIYMIATTFKKRIVKNSLDYYDKVNGLYYVELEITTNSGETKKVGIEACKCPLFQMTSSGVNFPEKITVEQFSPGTPDGLKFHFPDSQPQFKFSSSLIPDIPENIRFETPNFYDLNIEYIGKSVGKDGTREIADRLGNGHSKESLILNEITHKRTNLDAYAVLYKPGVLTIGEDGPVDDGMSYSELVDILEKSLISSFLPVKNEKSRNFPNDLSLPAKQLINMNVDNIHLTVKSPVNYGLLYTESIEKRKIHYFRLKIPNYR